MKKLRRTLALILAMAFVATLAGGAALAETLGVVSLKTGIWYTLETEEDTDSVFKLTLKKDAILTCKAKAPKLAGDTLEFELFDNRKCSWNGYVGGFGIGGGSGTWTEVITVAKGTYYLKAYTHDGPAKLKLSTKTAKKPANTTKSSAATLKKNEAATAIQLPAGANKLWYKIKLTRKQYITVAPLEWSGYYHPGAVSVYNAKGKKLTAAFSEGQMVYKTKAKQAAGTYYICVQKTTMGRKTGQGCYMKLLWR